MISCKQAFCGEDEWAVDHFAVHGDYSDAALRGFVGGFYNFSGVRQRH